MFEHFFIHLNTLRDRLHCCVNVIRILKLYFKVLISGEGIFVRTRSRIRTVDIYVSVNVKTESVSLDVSTFRI